jgi:aminopeptidase N
MIASLLDRYDRARGLAPDKRLMESAAGYSRTERISSGYRAALFFAALEDVCSRDSLSAAFRYIVRARAGDETGYEEFRAALESSSHRDLAEMFRRWLIQPGVPDDFRTRYARASNALVMPARRRRYRVPARFRLSSDSDRFGALNCVTTNALAKPN